jgi:hypothetical protein
MGSSHMPICRYLLTCRRFEAPTSDSNCLCSSAAQLEFPSLFAPYTLRSSARRNTTVQSRQIQKGLEVLPITWRYGKPSIRTSQVCNVQQRTDV